MRGEGFGGRWDGPKGAEKEGYPRIEERSVKRKKPTLKALNKPSAILNDLTKTAQPIRNSPAQSKTPLEARYLELYSLDSMNMKP